MCYNPETSLVTYLIGSGSSIYLLSTKKNALKISGLFFLLVSQMQLVEFLLWINNSCNQFNTAISNLGSIINHLEPIVLYLCVRYYNKDLSPQKKKILNILISFYVLGLTGYSTYVYPLSCSTITEEKHLLWNWNYKKYHVLFYTLFIVVLTLTAYLGIPKPYNYIGTALLLGTYLYSYYLYRDKKVLGSMWCWFSALIPLLLIAIDDLSDI
jgi:hypothetical protein